MNNENEDLNTRESKTETKILNNTNLCDSEKSSNKITNEANKSKTDTDAYKINNKRKLTTSEKADDQCINEDSDNDKPSTSTSSPLSPSKKRKLSSEESILRVNISPKKRLNLQSSPIKTDKREKFIYGNYSRYYGYRFTEIFHDIRLDIFSEYKNLFENKEILDIGCNTGLITISIAKQFNIKSIIGIDIDKNLINRAKKFLKNQRKKNDDDDGNSNNRNKNRTFPFNINFCHGNYVLRDDVLLEIEEPKFDLILCLSVTKWIHLNFGDNGLKQAFRRMYKQLRPGGKLILEPQAWDGYKRRKKLTPEIFKNFHNIQFFPENFNDYLLGPNVGFSEMYELGIPEHCQKGFRRPIYVYSKNENMK